MSAPFESLDAALNAGVAHITGLNATVPPALTPAATTTNSTVTYTSPSPTLNGPPVAVAPVAPVVPPAADAAPPWGDDANFDAEKAKKLILDLKADKDRVAARAFQTPEEFARAKQAMETVRTVEDAAKTDLQRANDEITRWQTEATRWREGAVRAQVEALAASDFADPSDAAAAVTDPARYLDAGGSIDTAAIKRDLDDLLARKPHYRRNAGGLSTAPRAPLPNRSQGALGTAPVDPAAEFAAIISGQLQ